VGPISDECGTCYRQGRGCHGLFEGLGSPGFAQNERGEARDWFITDKRLHDSVDVILDHQHRSPKHFWAHVETVRRCRLGMG
jgi:hypothetical protein